MNWTTPQDIRERWIGDDAPTNDELLRALISDAEAVILHDYPAIQARINAATLSQAVVTMVTCRMVTRVLRNPENASYISQTTGPFTQARNLGQTDLWLTSDEELISIRPKEPEDRRLTVTGGGLRMMFFVSVIGLPLFVILSGVSVWWRRR